MAGTERLGKRPVTEPVQLIPTAPVSDGQLVERARRGDQWAEEAFYRRHVALVRTTVRRLLGRSADAEDVVQDAFVTAFQIWPQLREPEHAKRWLLVIAVRKVHRRFRQRRVLRVLGLDQTTDDATLHALARPDLSSEARAELALLDRALRHLSGPERVAWMLRNVEGYTLEEIAELCECSLAPTKRRIAAAQKRVAVHVRAPEASFD